MRSLYKPDAVSKSRGFTLIEAIVALLIFSTAAMGIYSWINTNLLSLQRVAAISHAERVLYNAVEQIKLVDFKVNRTGTVQDGEFSVQWRAQAVEPWQNGVTALGHTGLYDLGLYEVDLTIYEQERYQGEYRFRYTVYEKVRSLEFE